MKFLILAQYENHYFTVNVEVVIVPGLIATLNPRFKSFRWPKEDLLYTYKPNLCPVYSFSALSHQSKAESRSHYTVCSRNW